MTCDQMCGLSFIGGMLLTTLTVWAVGKGWLDWMR